ncbi:MAG: septum formation initiator family protein [Bacteroidia bacterium]|nr:septum formation initiator family protein [Bacteroidia bacterium]
MHLGNRPLLTLFEGFNEILTNKYLLTFFLFLVWIIFFDKHSLITNHKLNDKLNELEEENTEYLLMIEETKEEIGELNQNLEKFAREKYFFQKENEDVFVIVKN